MDHMDFERIINLRSKLHTCPELSGCESVTLGEIESFLRSFTSLHVERREGWLLAKHWEGDDLPAVGFRADVDAIPDGCGGARHGCGHDGHAAILCGLALALEGRRLSKNVCLIFQPAEEIGTGAKMICDSWDELRTLTRIYGLHNIPGYGRGELLVREGCFACASCGLIVRAQGSPAHAAYPEDGINPAPFLCQLALEIPGMIEAIRGDSGRMLMSTLIGLRVGGENFGLSASEGELCLTLRAHRQEDLDALIAQITDHARAACAAAGMNCTFERRDPFPDTTNDPDAVAQSRAAWDKAELPVRELAEPMRWSEDFGWYLKHVPGMFFGVGIGEDHPGLHTQEYTFDDSIIARAVEALHALLK